MSKMTVIQLLNKIANGEENDLQTEFEFDGKIWNFYKLNHSEYCLDGWLLSQNITITKHKEILEEKKKIPEKLECFNLTTYSRDDKDLGLELHYTGVSNTFNDVYFKINEIIDYLKSKGE